MFKTNIYKLEIDITHTCTLRCYNCDRCMSIAPGNNNHNISVNQITKFINNSIFFNYPWERIKIIGGEPTLHPDFKIIVTKLSEYKKLYNNHLNLVLVTNGLTKKTQNKLKWVEKNYPYIYISNTKKTTNFQKDFNLFHIAPCDIYKNNHKYQGCWITETCAIVFNYSGFYCCAAGGAIARIFNYNIGIKNFGDINVKNFGKMFNLLCSKCGHYHGKKPTNYNYKMLSTTWKKALFNYNNSTKTIDKY